MRNIARLLGLDDKLMSEMMATDRSGALQVSASIKERWACVCVWGGGAAGRMFEVLQSAPRRSYTAD